VPFESPELRMARVCSDERDGLIAILRDFANNGTAYIVPWSSLPLAVCMTEHDRALHQGVGEANACTPAQVRGVVSRLALSGALGPEAKLRECARSDADPTRRSDVELLLILHLLDRCGADLTALAGDWQTREAKSVVTAAAKAVGVKRQDISRRIGELATLIAPIGLVRTQGAGQPGWLRMLHNEIAAFGQGMLATAQASEPRLREHLEAVAQAAERAAQLAGAVLEMLDYAVLDICGTVKRWEFESPLLRKTIERLDLMLDEWPSLMHMAHDGLRMPAAEAAAAFKVLHAMLPPTPEVRPSSQQDIGASSASDVLERRLAAIGSMLSPSRPVAEIEHT
jgi:hypothetical protein